MDDSKGRKRPSDSKPSRSKKPKLAPALTTHIVGARKELEALMALVSDRPALMTFLVRWKNALECLERQEPIELDDFNAPLLQVYEKLCPILSGDLVVATEWTIKRLVSNIRGLYGYLQDPPRAPCPPSVFAAGWPASQKMRDDLLFLRPTERRGLPLVTLHRVFQDYLRRLDESPSYAALDVASRLCSIMGDPFKTGAERSKAFNACARAGFPVWQPEFPIKSEMENVSVGIDFGFNKFGHDLSPFLTIIREDKSEPGEGGDAYPQASRDYQIWVQGLVEAAQDPDNARFLAEGAPVFIVCVAGPMLTVAGAFYDGRNCVIEPLGPAQWMLEDYTDNRQKAVAHVIYALQCGTQDLHELQRAVVRAPLPAQNYPPGVPRVYQTFNAFSDEYKGSTISLKTAKPSGISSWHPCFTTTIDIPSLGASRRVLLKMCSGPYGSDVHTTLAEQGYAPHLYGSFADEDKHVPNLYVMEMLPDTWISLSSFKPDRRQPYLDDIYRTLMHILGFMEQKRLVHGDVRTSNIMIHIVDGKPVKSPTGMLELKLVDFDWAGRAGEVRHPPGRNLSITWPAGAGEAIDVGHDRKLVDSWWASFADPPR